LHVIFAVNNVEHVFVDPKYSKIFVN